MFSWINFLLICSFAPLNHGGMYNDIPTGVQYHMHAKEAIIKTVEIDNMVIDCVDIYKQPTFQHPLLVNHTLQLKSNYPDKINDFATEASYLWNSSKSCPEGYIPIERIKRNGQFAGDILKVNSHKHPNLIRADGRIHEHSIIRASNEGYYGGKATMSLWSPKLDGPLSFSVTQIWIMPESFQDILVAGYMVDANDLGTHGPKFFIYRSADNLRTGCQNLDCPGFVQTNPQNMLGAALWPVSEYGGPQYVVHIEIFRDKITGNWWVRLQGADIGYWPKEIVPSLAEGATMIDFGGEVGFAPGTNHPAVEMGSGHFPSEGYGKSGYFTNVQVLDLDYEYQTHVFIEEMNVNNGCYGLQVGENREGPQGLYFFYGGPGKSENCHIID